MSYTLSPDQVNALQEIGKWYRSKSAPYLTLGGYAGTGKTTLVSYVRQALRENDPDAKVAFCAFTGKAARVLQQTLKSGKISQRGDYLGTLHRLIYSVELNSGGHITGWIKKKELSYSLVILDEASMVTEELWQDLLSFNVPILAVGDHGQLPPVGSAFNLMAEPQLKLERVYRQAADSPIVEVATLARTEGHIPPGRYGEDVIKYDRAGDEIGFAMEELLEQWRPEWLVLCGYNHTRVKLNQSLRERSGRETPDPEVGDQVVCLRNNTRAKLYNGMGGTITRVEPADDDKKEEWWRMTIRLDDAGDEYEGYVWRGQFGEKEPTRIIPLAPDGKRGDVFDFGYALTVHKAQGSQAGTVLLFEERTKHMSDEDWRRWLYTGVTRAAERLYIIG